MKSLVGIGLHPILKFYIFLRHYHSPFRCLSSRVVIINLAPIANLILHGYVILKAPKKINYFVDPQIFSSKLLMILRIGSFCIAILLELPQGVVGLKLQNGSSSLVRYCSLSFLTFLDWHLLRLSDFFDAICSDLGVSLRARNEQVNLPSTDDNRHPALDHGFEYALFSLSKHVWLYGWAYCYNNNTRIYHLVLFIHWQRNSFRVAFQTRRDL